MKILFSLIAIALSLSLYACGSGESSYHDDRCATGNCEGDELIDGDDEAENIAAEEDREDSGLLDLCANVICPAPPLCRKEAVCNPASGECESVFAEEGQSCDDGSLCNGLETCDNAGNCLSGTAPECIDNASCLEPDGECRCLKPFVMLDGECVPLSCESDSDCDDGLICNGTEYCNGDGLCAQGEAVTCAAERQCSEPYGTCLCIEEYFEENGVCTPKPPCPVPQTPTLSIVHKGAEIEFSTEQDYLIQLSITEGSYFIPESWQDAGSYTFNTDGGVNVFARTTADSCTSRQIFSFRYIVAEHYPPAAGLDGSTAIAKDSALLKAWASGYVEPLEYGSDLIEAWKTPQKALGPATGNSSDIVSLGNGGSITLTFDHPIRNGPSYDFAIFENAFNDQFLELAYVEVSSDGQHFQRFDSTYLGRESVGAFEYLDTTLIGGLAGKYRAGQGTPFDLQELTNRNEVLDGTVDLNNIAFVRIVDIAGDGRDKDSFGNPIYDPYPTVESAGFDLEAVGVINN